MALAASPRAASPAGRRTRLACSGRWAGPGWRSRGSTSSSTRASRWAPAWDRARPSRWPWRSRSPSCAGPRSATTTGALLPGARGVWPAPRPVSWTSSLSSRAGPGTRCSSTAAASSRELVPLGRRGRRRPAGHRHHGRHDTAGAGYRARRRSAREAARLLGMRSLRDAARRGVAAASPASLRRRARHVVTENGRVRAGRGACCATATCAHVGPLLDRRATRRCATTTRCRAPSSTSRWRPRSHGGRMGRAHDRRRVRGLRHRAGALDSGATAVAAAVLDAFARRRCAAAACSRWPPPAARHASPDAARSALRLLAAVAGGQLGRASRGRGRRPRWWPPGTGSPRARWRCAGRPR